MPAPDATLAPENLAANDGGAVIPAPRGPVAGNPAAPQVIFSSIQENDILASGNLTYIARFSKPMLVANLVTADALLASTFGRTNYSPSSFSYDASGTELTISYANLPDDRYTLTLFSGNGAFEDAAGNDLDGEPLAFPIPTNVSGNGVAGGDFLVDFYVDSGSAVFAAPVASTNPRGSLIASSSVSTNIALAGDTDRYTINLNAGQTLTAVVDALSTGLQSALQIKDPANAVIATSTASAAGKAILLENVPVTSSGTYTVTVASAAATTGNYSLQLTLNASVEAEPHGGASDNTLATAQNIDGSFISLGGNAWRGAVLGTGESSSPTVDYYAFSLTAGDTATLAVTGPAGTPSFVLYNAAGAQLSAGLSGPTNVSKALSDLVAPATGVYYVAVSPKAASNYNLVITRNATFSLDPNGSFATAQPLGLTGTVLGNVGLVTVASDDFETGSLSSAWKGGAFGASSSRSAASGTYALLTANTSSVASLIEATWTVDLTGLTQATLSFAHASFGDVPDPFGGDFTGHYNADGIAISADGVGWHPIFNSPVAPNGAWQNFAIDLAARAAEVGLTLGPQFKIRFQAYVASSHDRGWDNLAIIVPQAMSHYYSFRAAEGTTLQIGTATPRDGAGAPVNQFDPQVQLYNAAGSLVAADDNSAADGRNAQLNYAVPAGAGGAYEVRVTASPLTPSPVPGTYVLNVRGATTAPPPFQVQSISPSNAIVVNALPQVSIVFNQPVLLTSIQLSGVTVDGLAATGLTAVDPQTVKFNLPSVVAQGTHMISVAAGAIRSIGGAPIQAFSSQSVLDGVAPRVVSSSIEENDSLPAGNLTFVAQFSEPMAVGNIDPKDFSLKGSFQNVTFQPTSYGYDNSGTVLTISYAGLLDDKYTLTLLSADGRFEDPAGNDLDGEPLAFPIPANVSGNGVAGGNFFVDFYIDSGNAVFPLPLGSVKPAGSLVYASSISTNIASAADIDSYAVNLSAGQTLTAVVDALSTGLQSALQITDPANAVIATSTALAAGNAILLEDVPVTTSGTYTVTVSSSASTTGNYSLQLTLNAAVEAEAHGGASDNTLATAQNIDGSFISLDGNASRGAVLGTGESSGTTTVDYYAFSLTAGDTATLAVMGPAGSPSFALYNAAGAQLSGGLPGPSNVSKSLNDLVVPSTGVYYVAVSPAKGSNYNLVITRNATLNLEPHGSLATAQPLALTGTVLGNPGLATIAADDFETGTLSSAWSRYPNDVSFAVTNVPSATTGIYVLLTTSFSQGAAFNEATWMVDLTGVTRATLTFAHASFGDVPDPFGGDFTGHYSADGVAISADGVHWHPIFNSPIAPSGVWQNFAIDLSAKAAEAGMSLGPQFKIRFQAHDATSSGRGWDNLAITVPQAVNHYYSLQATEGSTLQIGTATPGDGPGAPANNFDPQVQLYDAAGSLVAADDNSAPDGRNAQLSYAVPAGSGGTYAVRVTASPLTPNPTTGDYVLRIQGLAPAFAPFQVQTTTPVNGAYVESILTQATVQFNGPALLTSIQLSGVTIDSVAATGFSMVDARTVAFTFPSVTVQGNHTISVAAGAISTVQNVPVQAYSSQFLLSTLPPRVIATSIQENDILPAGNLTYTVQFDKPMLVANLDATDFALRGNFLKVNYTPTSVHYDAAGMAATATYSNLPDDQYTLTAISSSGRFADQAGQLLDGEPVSSPIPPNRSGNGVAGGNFFVDFYLDAGTLPFPTLQAGYEVFTYSASVTATIAAATDTDSFTLDLDAGQKLSIVVDPASTLKPTVTLLGPGGNVIATSVGGFNVVAALIQSAPVDTTGTYTVVVGSAGGNGAYTVQLSLNAAIEAESHQLSANNSPPTAQDLDPSFVSFGDNVSTAVVTGINESNVVNYPAASSVLDFSSQRSAYFPSGAAQATGAGNVNTYGDSGSAWSPLSENGTLEYITVGFATPQYSDGAVIRENWGNGFVTQIDAVDTNNIFHTVWTGVDPSQPGAVVDFHPTWPVTHFLTMGLKVYVDANHNLSTWEEIDSITLHLPPLGDYYSFSLNAGEMATIFNFETSSGSQVANVSVLDANGALLATAAPITYAIPDFMAPYTGVYHAFVSQRIAIFNSTYTLVIAKDSEVSTFYNNQLSRAQSIDATGAVTQNRTGSDGSDGNYYKVQAVAGATLHISTRTPFDGPGQPLNAFDPQIALLDKTGALISTDDNSAADGRNAQLTYVVPDNGAGTYYVRVSASPLTNPATTGPYLLQVEGLLPYSTFQVSTALPDRSAPLRTAPATETITFNAPFLQNSVQLSGITIDGIVVNGWTFVSSTKIVVNVPSGLGEGTHTLSVAAGAVLDFRGQPVQAYTSQFIIDATPPRIDYSSIEENDVLPTGGLVYVVHFNEPLYTGNLTSSSITLNGTINNVSYVPSSYQMDSTGTRLTVTYANLPQDRYALSLVSIGNYDLNGFKDLARNDLDGEPMAFPVPPNLSGDGVGGGTFSVHFYLRAAAVPFPAFSAFDPAGSQIYSATAQAYIETPASTQEFSVGLKAGQVASFVVDPASTLRPTIELRDPSGAVVATSTAPSSGQSALLQTLPIPTAGIYRLKVGSLAGAGLCTAQVTINAAIRGESHFGPSSSTLATAQNIDGSLEGLGGRAVRGAVYATTDSAYLLPTESEFNGTIASANDASANFTNFSGNLYQLGLKGTLSTDGDWDFFNIGFLQAGDVLTITESGLNASRGSLANPQPRLFYDGGQLASGIDSGSDSMIKRYTITLTAIYYVAAVSDNHMTGSYEFGLWLEDEGHPPNTGGHVTSEIEPNWGSSIATDVSSSWQKVQYVSQTSGAFSSEGDADYYHFYFLAGDFVTVQVQDASGSPQVGFLNSAGAVRGQDTGATPLDPSELTGLVIPTTGDYYVRMMSPTGSADSYTTKVYLSTAANRAPAIPPTDYYSFTLSAGDIVSLELSNLTSTNATISFLNPSGATLATGTSGATNFSQGIADIVAPTNGTYYALVSGTALPSYSLVVAKNIDIEKEGNGSLALAQNVTATGAAFAYDGSLTSNVLDNDYFKFQAVAGQTLRIATATPGDSPGQPVNVLDPMLTLYTSGGTQIATDDNSAADRRNAVVTYSVQAAGTYVVQIQNYNGKGEYILHVDPLPPSAPPAAPILEAGSDSGTSSDDRLTRRSNKGPANVLVFDVPGTSAGATVILYADGVPIGSAVAQGSMTSISTDASSTLSSGQHSFTATQNELDKAPSSMSSPTTVTVDIVAPTAQIPAIAPNPHNGAIDQLQIVFSEPIQGFTLANLRLTRDGSTNLLTGSEPLSSNDQTTFTLGNLAGLTGIGGSYQLTLDPAGAAITDLAGNLLVSGASGSFLIDAALQVTNADDGGAGSLRQAILNANALGAGSHTILFAISGPSQSTIELHSNLPPIANSVVFDIPSGEVIVGGTSAFSLGDFASLTKIGAGTLTIAAPQIHGAGSVLTASAGVTNMLSDAGSVGVEHLTVNANAPVNFTGTQHLAGLNIGTDTTVTFSRPQGASQQILATAGLTLTSTSDLDLKDNSLIVHGGADPTGAFLAVEAAIKSAFNSFNLNGHGIKSSAVLDPTATGLGSILNSLFFSPLDAFNGHPVGDNDTIVKYTYMGDATLDGMVNDDDASLIGGFYDNGATPGHHWFEGDFTHDGLINDDDVSVLSGNYSKANVFFSPAPMAAAAAQQGTVASITPSALAPQPSPMVARPVERDASSAVPLSIIQQPALADQLAVDTGRESIDEDLLDLLATNSGHWAVKRN